MKLAHIMASSLQTGAGLGALALARGLRMHGGHSEFVGRVDTQIDLEFPCHGPPVLDKIWTGLWLRLERQLRVVRFGKTKGMFLPIASGLSPHRHPVVQGADVVVVQWAHAATLGPGFWRWLEHNGSRVVIILRDMWPFTGGCHFSNECFGYQTGCVTCPMLGSVRQTVTSNDIARKRRAIAGVGAVVAISEHIARCARSSTVLRDAPIQVIKNAIDTAAFQALDKASARIRLGLPKHSRIVAFGALDISDERKGSLVMRRIIAAMGKTPGVHWATFGSNPFPMPQATTAFGRVTDKELLNTIYAAADVFLMPSLQETFGKVTAEALASGTPVIAFRDTPAEEILSEHSGWLVPHGDSEVMLRVLQQTLNLPQEILARMGRKGRAHVLAHFSPEIVGGQHMALYHNLVAASARTRTR